MGVGHKVMDFHWLILIQNYLFHDLFLIEDILLEDISIIDSGFYLYYLNYETFSNSSSTDLFLKSLNKSYIDFLSDSLFISSLGAE